MKVKSIKRIGTADVFNMSVDDTHEFIIQGGVVSHNCDDLRYFCMSRPIAPRIIEEKYEPMLDPLNQIVKTNGGFDRYNAIIRR